MSAGQGKTEGGLVGHRWSDAATYLANDVKNEFGWTRANSKAVVRFILDRIKERALFNGEKLVFPHFGSFDRRLVDHGKQVWNSRGGGGESRTQFVLRFSHSRDFARTPAVPVSEEGNENAPDPDPFNGQYDDDDPAGDHEP